jgi:hypothetical protein
MDMSKAWHLLPGRAEIKKDVTQFDNDIHPRFRSVTKDPRKLQFSHERHLLPGIPIKNEKDELGGPLKKHENGAPVQLQCASCHQLDTGDFGFGKQQVRESPKSVLGQRDSGAYMLPVTYENHCQACHPLTIARKHPGDENLGLLAVPHRWQPDKLHGFLVDFFTAQVARGQAGFMEKKLTRPLPGKMPALLEPTAREAIQKNVEVAEKALYTSAQTCRLCHMLEGKGLANAIKAEFMPGLHIAPTNVPRVWFQHAKFNHTAHRAVQCADCHDMTKDSEKNIAVLIPNRENCVQCHAPTTKAGTPGARFNCTECHLYHNRGTITEDPFLQDHFLQGIGAAKRNPSTARTVMDFLFVK